MLLTGWAVGTAFVLRALLARLAGRGVALFGVLLWAVSPYFILMSVNGLETGVALFFTLALPLAYCAWIHGERAPDAKRALAFGGLAGLAILARLDLALLLAGIAIDWLIRERARGSAGRPRRRPDCRRRAGGLAALGNRQSCRNRPLASGERCRQP